MEGPAPCIESVIELLLFIRGRLVVVKMGFWGVQDTSASTALHVSAHFSSGISSSCWDGILGCASYACFCTKLAMLLLFAEL